MSFNIIHAKNDSGLQINIFITQVLQKVCRYNQNKIGNTEQNLGI